MVLQLLRTQFTWPFGAHGFLSEVHPKNLHFRRHFNSIPILPIVMSDLAIHNYALTLKAHSHAEIIALSSFGPRLGLLG